MAFEEEKKKKKSRRKEEFLGPKGFQWTPFHIFGFIWLVFLAFQFYNVRNTEVISYTKFLNYLENGQIKEVTVSEDRIQIELLERDLEKRKNISTIPIEDPKLAEKLYNKGVDIKGTPKRSFFRNLLSWLVPIAFFLIIWNFILRKTMGSAGSNLLSFNKSKARVYIEKGIGVTFADIAGVEEAKEELQEIVGFLKDPSSFGKLGGRAPKGILLVGPPGTGKTLMARAVAGEANVPFYYINGSEFVELFVGMGAARVRDLFEQARQNSPCIIFIDELDALGKARGIGPLSHGGADEKEQTLNQLLAELDGFDSRSGVILLAATNRPEVLDPALLRSGRFDRQILIDNPDLRGRIKILEIHSKKIKLDPSTNLERVAALTPGFSGADIENLVNEAALVATRRKGKGVTEKDFTAAIERIVAGLERKNRIINPEEKRRIAYHEMGHVSAALALDSQDRVQKVSIIPRGIGALGYTLQRPTEDRYLHTKEQLEKKIAVLLGGRVSEQSFFSDISTGASDDLTKATDIARAMVTQFSMGEDLGLSTYENLGSQFLQNSTSFIQRSQTSEMTKQLIDKEVNKILDNCKDKTSKAILANKDFINEAVKRLIEKETLDEYELKSLWEEKGQVIFDSKSS